METHGPDDLRAPTGPEPAQTAGPGLRVGLDGLIVMEATDALCRLLSCDRSAIEGGSLERLCGEAERPAVRARFDDVVLLGRDRFGALAIRRPGDGRPPVWVEVDARFEYAGGERIEVTLQPIERPPAPTEAVMEERPVAESGEVAERGAEDAEALALDALEATGAAVLLVDADGRVGGATRAVERLLGRSPGEARHQQLDAMLALAPPARGALDAARSEGMRQTILADVPGRDEPLVVEWVPGLAAGRGYAVLSAAEGKATGDTERVRLQAQLVSHVSHDLRGALASTYSGLRTLVADLPEGSPQHETAVQSLAELQRAHRIVDEVLALSRPGRLRRAETDLAVLITGMLERYRAAADETGVTLEAEIEPGLVVVVDRSSIERSLANLVENALRAMDGGGELELRAVAEDRVGPGVAISIADTGQGIPPHLQQTVFEPFVSESEGGSGLGLTIARHIVVAHGGQIDFQSEPGRGTTFRVWLPRLA